MSAKQSPVPTANHAPLEWFLYKYRIGFRTFTNIVEDAGWAVDETGIRDDIIYSGTMAKSGQYRRLYHKERLCLLIEESKRKYGEQKPLRTIVRLMEEMRKSRPSRRQAIFEDVQKHISDLSPALTVQLMSLMRKNGINPAKPLDAARTDDKRAKRRRRKKSKTAILDKVAISR